MNGLMRSVIIFLSVLLMLFTIATTILLGLNYSEDGIERQDYCESLGGEYSIGFEGYCTLNEDGERVDYSVVKLNDEWRLKE